jgi:hypothetical protein
MIELLPDFGAELERGLRDDGEDTLVSQVPSLRIDKVCGCGDDFCASFSTGPKPNGTWGEGHRNVTPRVDAGMVILDVVNGVIRYVEVLWRDDVREIVLPEESAT